jgi:predicted DNA-binding protein (MmcQ/YjbR family)
VTKLRRVSPPLAASSRENDGVPSFADRLRQLALSFPQAYEDAPWGFPVFKVGANKLFAWMIEDSAVLAVTLKPLPEERPLMLELPWVSVARYLGRYGWVTARVTDEETLAVALEWLRDSYWQKAPRAVRDAAYADNS